MSAVFEGTSSNNAEAKSVLLAEIDRGVEKKRPRALTEEQKTDILVAYHYLQVKT